MFIAFVYLLVVLLALLTLDWCSYLLIVLIAVSWVYLFCGFAFEVGLSVFNSAA